MLAGDGVVTATATALSSSKSVAISRKVGRLLDVTVNDNLWQVLEYVGDKCVLTTPTSASTSTASPQHPPNVTIARAHGASSGAPHQRPIKNQLEDHVLALHRSYLNDFSRLRQSFRQCAEYVQELDECSAAMQQSLSDHRSQAEELLASVGMLRAELDEVRAKELQVKRFMEQYSLTLDETTLLRSGDINSQFLDILNKVRCIHRSCKDLLVANHQQAAVEIMESMYLLHMAAIERLVKHLLNAVSEVMAHDIPDVSDLLIGLVRAVQDRPAQWSKVMHEVARVRKTAVLRRFYDLLTKGNARSGRPLETVANEPVRFFGELFAWLHQCLAEEGDLLDSFFSTQSPLSSSTASARPPSDSAGDGCTTKQDVMDIIFEGLCKHIKGRLEGALELHRRSAGTSGPSLHSAIIVLFQLEGVFGYFSVKVAEFLGPSAALSNLLANGKLDVMRTFYDLLKTSTQKLIHLRPRQVAVPAEVTELLRVLQSMVDTMDSSLIAHSEREVEFAPALGAIVDPMLSLAQHAELDDIKKALLRLNILTAIHAALVGYSFTSGRQQKISDLIQTETDLMVEWSTAKLLASFGFDERVKQSPESAWNVLQQLYSYTATAGSLPIAHLESFQSVRVREAIARRVTENVCTSYDALFSASTPLAGVDASAIEPRKLRVMLDNLPTS